MTNDKSAAALKYFLIMCESMALDPDADCNPELKYIKSALTPDAKEEENREIRIGDIVQVCKPYSAEDGQQFTVERIEPIVTSYGNQLEYIGKPVNGGWVNRFCSPRAKLVPSQPQAVAEPIEDYGLTITGTGRNPITREIKTITLRNEENGETENFINRRLVTPPAKDTTSEAVERVKELFIVPDNDGGDQAVTYNRVYNAAINHAIAALSRGKD